MYMYMCIIIHVHVCDSSVWGETNKYAYNVHVHVYKRKQKCLGGGQIRINNNITSQCVGKLLPFTPKKNPSVQMYMYMYVYTL